MKQAFGGNEQVRGNPIWIIAQNNNKKPLVVRRHKCKNASYFTGC